MKKPNEDLKRIGLVSNPEKAATRAIVLAAARLIAETGRSAFVDHASAAGLEAICTVCTDVAALARSVDVLLVFGGDGTILRVVREIDGADTPILGINAGRLGFLTAVSSTDLEEALQRLWDGAFVLERRPLIEASAETTLSTLRLRALNDIVISRGAASRMIELDVSVNGEALTCYRSDGLIVSSPTGSTAYSLSAGGAIVSPDAEVFAMTPICPHTLSNRSLIVSLNAVIQVRVKSERLEVTASADGQIRAELQSGDIITIARSDRAVQLLHLAGSSFFETLRQKLHWSGSNF